MADILGSAYVPPPEEVRTRQ